MGFFGAYGFHPRHIVVPPPVITGYDQIQEEGVNLTQENILDFQGSGVTATNGVGKTIVTIPGNSQFLISAITELCCFVAIIVICRNKNTPRTWMYNMVRLTYLS